jgi:5-methyltetrahydrofolate--homocysteine methyltransferase
MSPSEEVHPLFWGVSQVLRWDPKMLLDAIDHERLFKEFWSAGDLSEADYRSAVTEEFEPVLKDLTNELAGSNLCEPQGLYGFFRCTTNGNTLTIADFYAPDSPLVSLNFPALPDGGSIIRPLDPDGDIIALQVIALGTALREKCRICTEKGQARRSGYLRGLGRYLMINVADRVTREIRRALAISYTQGVRHRFDEDGMPGPQEQAKLLELLGVEERLGITLSKGDRLLPEFSQLAIFLHGAVAEKE